MKILVLGGNGFIGSHLIDCLVKHGHRVRVFDVSHERFRKPNEKIDYRIADLNDNNALYEAMLDIEVVFHLASASVPSSSNIDVKMNITKNVFPTISILENMTRIGIKRLVYLSSGGAVYGNKDEAIIKEDEALNPISPYGINKVTIENYINLYSNLHSLDALIIRPSNPYGPRQGHFVAQGVISTFLRKAKLSEPFQIFGNGSNKKDYIFITDLIDCMYSLFTYSASGIFNIGSQEGTSINEIIDYVNDVTGIINETIYIAVKEYDVKDFILNTEKLESIIGQLNKKSIKEGISLTWDWINENVKQ